MAKRVKTEMHIEQLGNVTAILGSQWGDEGKGKIVDVISQEYDVCARFNGGSNAGHSIVVDGVKFAFHLMPSGILNPKMVCVIGNGCVVHIPTLFKELDQLDARNIGYKGRLFVSDRAHIVFDFHQTIDGMREGELRSSGLQIGTTKRGIGPCYQTKMARSGLRMCDLMEKETFGSKLRSMIENAQRRFDFETDVDAEVQKYDKIRERIAPLITDTVILMNEYLDQKKKILLEGANAALLDIDHGTYPYVTSSNPTIGGAFTGLGIRPQCLTDVIGVVKAYTTRVGDGPFPTENEEEEIGGRLRSVGHEFGTTTGRPRRCGWFDVVVVKHAALTSGYTSLNLTKLDVLSGFAELKVAVSYKLNGKEIRGFPASLTDLSRVEVVYETLPGWSEDITEIESFAKLPKTCREYVERLEKLLGVPIKWIGNGPGRTSLIYKP